MKNNIPYIVIGALILLILILGVKTCKQHKDTVVSIDTLYVHDTTYRVYTSHDTLYSPPLVIHVPGKVEPVVYDDSKYRELYAVYSDIVDSLYSTNVQSDRVYLKDSIGKRVGTVNITDSVRANRIYSRLVNYNLSLPVITNTLTVTKKVIEHKNMFYIGGGIQGNKRDIISGVNGALLWKNRNDGIFGIGAVYDSRNNLSLQVQKYWRIK